MRKQADVLRSLKRYVALALGSEWEVRLSGEEGSFHRPFARVSTAGPSVTSGSAMERLVTQGFSVVCHPVESELADDARMEAARVEELLWVAFNQGIDPALYGPGHGLNATTVVRRRHPLRVPLFDYDGVAMIEAVGEGERDRVARIVSDPEVEIVAGDDELMLAVVANIRMSWGRNAAVLSNGVTLTTVTSTPEAD